jgi:hypothetical protein
MADKPVAARTLTEALAGRGLIPVSLNLTAYAPPVAERVRRAYEGYADRAAEMGETTAYIAGLARACADILCGQDDPALVSMLAPLIAAEELTPAETVKRATLLLTYFHAQAPAPSA